jgi:cytochrome c5
VATADDVFIRQFLIILACMVIYAIGAAFLGRGIAADAVAKQAAGEAATIERIKPAGQPNVAAAAKESSMASTAVAATKDAASGTMAKAKDMTAKAVDATKSAADSAMKSASGAMASAKAAASDMADKATEAAKSAADQVAAATGSAATAVAAATTGKDGEEVYKGVCFACHSTGVANAPKVGDAAAWTERAKRGMDSLMETSIKGKGAMPARGGNPSISDADLRNAIQWMLENSGQ